MWIRQFMVIGLLQPVAHRDMIQPINLKER
jgi:hypothetical protein